MDHDDGGTAQADGAVTGDHRIIADEERGAIGRRVRPARLHANLRVFDLAVALKRLPHTVYRWEGGHADPCMSDCRRIAAETGCSLSWLLTGEGEMRAA